MKVHITKKAVPCQYLKTYWLRGTKKMPCWFSEEEITFKKWVDFQCREYQEAFPDENYVVLKRYSDGNKKYEYAIANIPETELIKYSKHSDVEDGYFDSVK